MSQILLEQKRHLAMIAMHTTPEAEEKVVKRALYDGMRSNGVKQEIVAKVLNVNQSSISRMTNPNEDLHLSVAALSLLNKDPFTAPVAEEIMQSIGGQFLTVDVPTDGNMLDEFLELTAIGGKLATILEDGVDASEIPKVEKLVGHLDGIVMRLRMEIQKAKSSTK